MYLYLAVAGGLWISFSVLSTAELIALEMKFCLQKVQRTFPTVKSKTIGFLLDVTQQYTTVLFTKTPRALLPEKELLSSHYVAYSEVAACDSTMNALKIAGVLGRMSSATDMRLTSCFSRDKTERCCKDQ